MASRKEQKEALRREREERERQAREAAQRRKMVGYGAGGALGVVAIVGVAVALLAGGGGGGGKNSGNSDLWPGGGTVPKQRITDLPKAAAEAGCRLQSFAATSRQHITDINQKVRYRTNPPTANKHYEIPAQDGVYTKAPPDVALVHTQEHGRVIIWAKPTLPKPDRADLKSLFDDDPYQMVLVPRAKMPYAVAATAWGREPLPNGTGFVMGCTSFKPAVFDALRAFRDEHRGNGPEAVQ